MPDPEPDLVFRELTADRWRDFEKLFGDRGACGGCWCRWWRLKRTEFEQQKGAGNKRAMRRIVRSGEVPGILAYSDSEPVAWCSVAPREAFPVLERSRVLKRVDDALVWSIVCFFINKNYRNQGMSIRLLRAAIEYVKEHGGDILEGYPTEPKNYRVAPAFVWTGLASAFRNAGFVEVARRSQTRPIMRYQITA